VTKRPRRNHSPGFKAKAAMEALRGEKTMIEIAQEYDVHPNQIQEWKKRLITKAEQVFESKSARSRDSNAEKVQELHAKIGELMLERDSLTRALRRCR